MGHDHVPVSLQDQSSGAAGSYGDRGAEGAALWRLPALAVDWHSSVVTLLTTGYIHPFVWVLFLAGSRDVPIKKILEVYLVITGAGMILAYGASMLGVIENLQYVTYGRGIRNSFGIVYTTDFSAHIFYMMVIGFYLLGERLCGCSGLGMRSCSRRFVVLSFAALRKQNMKIEYFMQFKDSGVYFGE